jgi:hypothetical protein
MKALRLAIQKGKETPLGGGEPKYKPQSKLTAFGDELVRHYEAEGYDNLVTVALLVGMNPEDLWAVAHGYKPELPFERRHFETIMCLTDTLEYVWHHVPTFRK